MVGKEFKQLSTAERVGKLLNASRQIYPKTTKKGKGDDKAHKELLKCLHKNMRQQRFE